MRLFLLILALASGVGVILTAPDQSPDFSIKLHYTFLTVMGMCSAYMIGMSHDQLPKPAGRTEDA